MDKRIVGGTMFHKHNFQLLFFSSFFFFEVHDQLMDENVFETGLLSLLRFVFSY